MNPVVHFEIPYEDSTRIVKFYETVFDWKLQILGEEMGGYVLATTTDSDVKSGAPAGGINGGFFPKMPGTAEHLSIVIAVDSIIESMNKVNQAGGKVLGEPTTIQGIGEYVSFVDTEGNRLSMLQPDMNSAS